MITGHVIFFSLNTFTSNGNLYLKICFQEKLNNCSITFDNNDIIDAHVTDVYRSAHKSIKYKSIFLNEWNIIFKFEGCSYICIFHKIMII